MGKGKKTTLTGEFKDNHNPMAFDLRTPKYRKRIAETKKDRESRKRGLRDYDLD